MTQLLSTIHSSIKFHLLAPPMPNGRCSNAVIFLCSSYLTRAIYIAMLAWKPQNASNISTGGFFRQPMFVLNFKRCANRTFRVEHTHTDTHSYQTPGHNAFTLIFFANPVECTHIRHAYAYELLWLQIQLHCKLWNVNRASAGTVNTNTEHSNATDYGIIYHQKLFETATNKLCYSRFQY